MSAGPGTPDRPLREGARVGEPEAPPGVAPGGEDGGGRWARRAVWLVSATMAYNAVEAGLAVFAGVRAGSVALVGFGLDSVVELVAGGLVLSRVRLEVRGAGSDRLARAESRVRMGVGLTFFALAAYVVGYAGWVFVAGDAPSESVLGIALAVASLVLMPLIAAGKFRAASELESGSLRAEAKETLACAYLSLCLLVGLTLNAFAGWWWADPAAALLMVPWLVREGAEGLEGGREP